MITMDIKYFKSQHNDRDSIRHNYNISIDTWQLSMQSNHAVSDWLEAIASWRTSDQLCGWSISWQQLMQLISFSDEWSYILLLLMRQPSHSNTLYQGLWHIAPTSTLSHRLDCIWCKFSAYILLDSGMIQKCLC